MLTMENRRKKNPNNRSFRKREEIGNYNPIVEGNFPKGRLWVSRLNGASVGWAQTHSKVRHCEHWQQQRHREASRERTDHLQRLWTQNGFNFLNINTGSQKTMEQCLQSLVEIISSGEFYIQPNHQPRNRTWKETCRCTRVQNGLPAFFLQQTRKDVLFQSKRRKQKTRDQGGRSKSERSPWKYEGRSQGDSCAPDTVGRQPHWSKAEVPRETSSVRQKDRTSDASGSWARTSCWNCDEGIEN